MLAVLIVDDEPLIRWALRHCLQDHYEVLEGADGASAMEQINRHSGPIAIGLLDLKLPDGDRQGLEILRALKAHDPATKAIIMTAFATPELVAEARAAGANAVIDKPFDLDALAQIIQTAQLQ